MTNNPRKSIPAYQGAYPGSDLHEAAGDRLGSGFDLRETLGDTRVRETSFAEFLAELKRIDKPGTKPSA